MRVAWRRAFSVSAACCRSATSTISTAGRSSRCRPRKCPRCLPQLSPSEQQQLESLLSNAGDLDLNSQAFRAQGIESEVEYTVFKNLFLRAAIPIWTRWWSGPSPPTRSNLPLTPVCRVGRPRHFPTCRSARLTRCVERVRSIGHRTRVMPRSATTANNIRWVLRPRIATRSDDSTFLAGRDFAGGNSLLLPNRNLDFGYTKLDLGGSYQFLSWLAAYAQLDNLTSNKKIAPIGYPSLPFTFRVGLRLAIGHSGK